MTSEQVHHLVKMTRDFTLLFYKVFFSLHYSGQQICDFMFFVRSVLFLFLFFPKQCRKNGSPLYKHYKVYKRPNCGQCSGTVTVCRLGDNGRMTYYCQRCQTGDPSEVNIRLAAPPLMATRGVTIHLCHDSVRYMIY